MFRKLPIVFFSMTATALTFNGTGQLRALTSGGIGDDIGCLTDGGLWTMDNSTCGTFTGVRSNGSNIFTISTSNGTCALGDIFDCAENNTATAFWAWSNLSPDWDFLAYGETITFSGETNVSLANAVIRSYRTEDPRPWVWLGWESL